MGCVNDFYMCNCASLAGSFIGGLSGSFLADSIDAEIEEFSKWQLY